MRIAFHVPRASHLEPGESGDKSYVRRLLAGLTARGHEVHIVSRVNVRNIWRGRVSLSEVITEALAVSRKMRRFSPDAWFIYDASVTNPDLFGWWQRPRRYVHINTNAGTGKRLPKWWRRIFAFAHRRSLARADWVVAERPSSAEELRAFGVAEEHLRVLPPAVSPWEWMPSRHDARRHLDLPPEAPVILCVSRLTSQVDDKESWKTQSVLELVDAMGAAPLPPDALLLLVGGGPGRQRVEDRIAELRIQRQVRLFGKVPHDEVQWFFAACDFFAYPTVIDRMLNVVLEAQACGRPVVGMRTRSAEETVDAGRTGLLAENREELRTNMAALATDRARCESMGRAARVYVAQFHSIETRVRQIENFLSGIGYYDRRTAQNTDRWPTIIRTRQPDGR